MPHHPTVSPEEPFSNATSPTSGNLESWCLVRSIRTGVAFTDVSCSCRYVTQRILARTAVNIPESLTTLGEEEVSAFFNIFYLPNSMVPDSRELICLVRWLANVLNLGNSSCRLNNCLSNCFYTSSQHFAKLEMLDNALET